MAKFPVYCSQKDNRSAIVVSEGISGKVSDPNLVSVAENPFGVQASAWPCQKRHFGAKNGQPEG
ncbi:MAG: hypothetical protein JW709_05470 [Sedimentisphaerales bacterium]|nr:hypothetical protein [Sedimentisphaerales bacterium]